MSKTNEPDYTNNLNRSLTQSNVELSNKSYNRQNSEECDEINEEVIKDANLQQIETEKDQASQIKDISEVNTILSNVMERVEIANENLVTDNNVKIPESDILRTQQTLKISGISKLKEMIIQQKTFKQSNIQQNIYCEIKEQLLSEQDLVNTDNEIDQENNAEQSLNLLLK